MPLSDLARITGVELRENAHLAPLTSFGIGGHADLLIIPKTLQALESVLAVLTARGIPFRILGKGSNLLVDEGRQGVVITMLSAPGSIEKIASDGPGRLITVPAGCPLGSLISWSLREGLTGIEHLAGIPASVGGAIAMNAGTPEGSMEDVTEAVLLVSPDGSPRWIPSNAIGFRYRGIDIPHRSVIAAARIRLEVASDPAGIARAIWSTMKTRRLRQPLGKKSAGCVFKNPDGDLAGRLIDSCGLKGHRIGSAQVSEKHANFIVNLGGAGFSQVARLMDLVRERVFHETGRTLDPEIQIWRRQAA